jgi:hypothetical protein
VVYGGTRDERAIDLSEDVEQLRAMLVSLLHVQHPEDLRW